MSITENLKMWLVENCGTDKDATDEELRKAVGEAFANDKLTVKKYGELTELPEQKNANEFVTKLDKVADGLENLTKLLASDAEAKVKAKVEEKKVKVKDEKPSDLSKLVSKIDEGAEVRVKSAAESYSTTKSALVYPKMTEKGTPHPYGGRRVMSYNRPVDELSDLDKALSGVWTKFQIMSVTQRFGGSAAAAWERLPEHEKSLLDHLLSEKCEWDDSLEGRDRQMKGYPGGIKALIDDSTSGGLEAAPIVFDQDVIQAALLYGELFPLVTQIPIERGRRIEGVSTGTVTGGWGGVDDTAVSLFNTASHVSAFDTSIYRWQGSVRIGLDFLSDTPINFNAHFTQQYGLRFLADMDNVIATGNGTSQPEGIVNCSGITSVAWGGATSLSNYEALRYSVSQAEHNGPAGASAVFCGNEVSLSRAMGLAVGTSDQRRVFQTISGPDYDARRILQRPYKLNESLANTQIFYAIMNRYRMYRRKGFVVRTVTEGETLVRRNEILILVMARYGGQFERGACAGITTTAAA